MVVKPRLRAKEVRTFTVIYMFVAESEVSRTVTDEGLAYLKRLVSERREIEAAEARGVSISVTYAS